MAQRDMFLRIEGSRQGLVRGESLDKSHLGEIDVMSWSWGMDSPGDAFGLPTGRTNMELLRVSKRVDSATTALMSALRNNEVIRRAVLTVRKAGDEALAYLTITVENARLVHQRVMGGEGADSSILSEELGLSFQKVTVEYVPQIKTGGGRGTNSFETTINEKI
ncbi:type VI secretion system tube protein Hcp [Malikia sp.]|uniref:Hcp family type VI secretion system effector n=1 Tax=Malikia sp. TaxID=2070706 RepID=UPI002621A14D|nr:type VI secretion system tube protein Hcp [Malikia sp.]MDD2730227.1 type VI secretion system tube protein Hcp [Malikia sp.]